jgi:predicted RecB family nuclease
VASFRELKGIGPATEAKLHEAGVYTWAALAEVETALGNVRGSNGDTLRDLSAQIADRASAAGRHGPPLPSTWSRDHVVAFDVGNVIGGRRRSIDLVVSTT